MVNRENIIIIAVLILLILIAIVVSVMTIKEVIEFANVKENRYDNPYSDIEAPASKVEEGKDSPSYSNEINSTESNEPTTSSKVEIIKEPEKGSSNVASSSTPESKPSTNPSTKPDTNQNTDQIPGQTPVPTPTPDPVPTPDTPSTQDPTPPEKPTVIKYTVSFDVNGGSAISSQIVEKGQTITKPSNPIRNGYTFLGWYLGNEPFDFTTKITNNVVLTAKWEKNQPQNPSENISYIIEDVPHSAASQIRIFLTRNGIKVQGTADITSQSGKTVNITIPVTGYMTVKGIIQSVTNIKVN